MGGHNDPELEVPVNVLVPQSLPCNLHPIPCHPKILCVGS